MKGARLRTPAKLNWDLRVLGRRADGYHELRSWFVALGWWDELTAAPEAGAAASSLAVRGPAASGVPADAENLVLRAEAAWRAAFPERARALPALRWRLQKEIPHAAGLGGGSANAAGALVLLERMAAAAEKVAVPDGAGESLAPRATLAEIARGLGSDVAFFLEHAGLAELRGGRGEILLARAPLPAPWFVVAVPDCAVSTAAVYAALGAAAWTATPHVEPDAPVPPALPGPNELAAAAAQVQPALISFSDALREHGPFLMTGSGSAFFAPCADAAAAQRLAARIAPLCRLARPLPALDYPALSSRSEHTP